MRKTYVKFLVLTFFGVLFLFGLITTARAEGEFLIDASVEYYLQDDGTTRVTHNITLENAFPTLYAKSYSLNLENIDPTNIQAKEGEKDLDLNEKRQDNLVTLEVNFPDSLVGKGVKRNFSIVFDVADFAVRTGEVWEISIPRLEKPENYRDYSVVISVPNKLGNEAYISPEPINRQHVSGRTNLIFNKETIANSGISAGFGEFQVFSFTLNYHLENPLNHTAETEIALPPDSAFQKVYYQEIIPQPESVRVDEDGNWLAKYVLKKRERVDIKVTGSVQIYAKERDFMRPSQEVLNKNLASTEYWQKDDPEIVKLAGELKTPKNIYNFVTGKLSYDYRRVKPNEVRLGASEALKNPEKAICMEFTDLFIAIARASGIPAREINGFAYTENPEIQPLSLVSDVLHSWPEYWDEARGAWIPVDPTWGATTGGIDYFSKLDLRHFAFVIHGLNASEPYAPGSYKLGPNPQKDVFVNFGKLPTKLSSDIKLTANIIQKIPLVGAQVAVSVENTGPLALYGLTPSVFFDKTEYKYDTIPVLLPFNTFEFKFKIPFTFLGTKTPNTIKILVGGKSLEIPSYKQSVILTSLLILFIILFLTLALIFLRLKKNHILNLLAKIKLKTTNAFKSDKDSQIPK